MSIALTVNGAIFDYPEQGDTNWGDAATLWAQAVTNGMLQKAGGSFILTSEVDFGTMHGLMSTYYKARTPNPALVGTLRLGASNLISWRNNANSADVTLGIDGSDQLIFNGVPLQASIVVADTNSIDMSNTMDVLSADLKISAAAASAGTIRNALSIKVDGVASEWALSDVPLATSSNNGFLSSADWTTFNSKQAAGNYITSLTGHVVASGPGAANSTIQSNVITNDMVNASAGIVYSKLSLGNSIVNADISASAGIVYSKLSLGNSIVNADISTTAAIAISKLAAITSNRALVSNGSGVISASTVTATEIGYVGGVTSSIQTQLNARRLSPQVANSRSTGLSVSAATVITPTVGQDLVQFVAGNGGAVTVTATAPVETASMVVGQTVTIIGTSDTNTVTYQNGNNLRLNGSCTLGKDDSLTLMYVGTDGSNAAWSEVART